MFDLLGEVRHKVADGEFWRAEQLVHQQKKKVPFEEREIAYSYIQAHYESALNSYSHIKELFVVKRDERSYNTWAPTPKHGPALLLWLGLDDERERSIVGSFLRYSFQLSFDYEHELEDMAALAHWQAKAFHRNSRLSREEENELSAPVVGLLNVMTLQELFREQCNIGSSFYTRNFPAERINPVLKMYLDHHIGIKPKPSNWEWALEVAMNQVGSWIGDYLHWNLTREESRWRESAEQRGWLESLPELIRRALAEDHYLFPDVRSIARMSRVNHSRIWQSAELVWGGGYRRMFGFEGEYK